MPSSRRFDLPSHQTRVRRRVSVRRGRAARHPTDAPKRRGKVSKKHTVGQVAARQRRGARARDRAGRRLPLPPPQRQPQTSSTSTRSTGRPAEKKVEGQREPLNVLVMGSDTRDGEGNNIDNLTGGGGVRHHDPVAPLGRPGARLRRQHPARLARRPARLQAEDGETIPGGTDVMWNEAFSVGGPAARSSSSSSSPASSSTTSSWSTSPASRTWSTPSTASGLHPRGHRRPRARHQHPGRHPRDQRREALNYVRARYTLGDGSDIGRIKRQQAFIAAHGNKGHLRRHARPASTGWSASSTPRPSR